MSAPTYVDPFGPPTGPVSGAATRPGCRVDGDRLHLDALVTADPDSVAGARRAAAHGRAALDAWCRAALAIGARSLASAAGTAGTDLLATRVDAMTAAVTATAQAAVGAIVAAVDRATDPTTGTVAVSVRDSLVRLGTDLDALVAGEDAPLRLAVSRAVQQASAEAAGRVEREMRQTVRQVRAAVSPADPDGPIALLRGEVLRVGAETRQELGTAIGRVQEGLLATAATGTALRRSAVKGAGYEHQVVEALTDVAAGAGLGDTVEATGATSGAGGGRHGDAVLTVAAAAAPGVGPVRVVVEAKDSKLSSAAWARELELAVRNRGAAAAVGVVRGTAAMPGGAAVLALSPERLVVSWDPDVDDGSLLRAVVLLARASGCHKVLAASTPDLDRAALGAHVREALALLTRFDEVQKASAAGRRALEQLDAAAARLREDLAARLGAGARLLGPVPA